MEELLWPGEEEPHGYAIHQAARDFYNKLLHRHGVAAKGDVAEKRRTMLLYLRDGPANAGGGIPRTRKSAPSAVAPGGPAPSAVAPGEPVVAPVMKQEKEEALPRLRCSLRLQQQKVIEDLKKAKQALDDMAAAEHMWSGAAEIALAL